MPTAKTTKGPSTGREIARAYGRQDVTQGFAWPGGIISPQDSVLISQGGGSWEIYTETLRDEQCKAAFEQRIAAVIGAEWDVTPGADDAESQRAAEFAKASLERIGFDRITEKMLFSRWYGFAVAELVWAFRDGFWDWSAIKARDRARFRFDDAQALKLLTWDSPATGIPADAPYFWHLSAGGDHDDLPYGKGLGHWCFWPVLFKRNGIKFWLMFLEKFGAPTAIGKFPSGADDAARGKLLDAAASVHTDSALIIPDDLTLELLEAARTGTGTHSELVERMDAAIAKAIVGATLTSDVAPNGGNRALGQVHERVAAAIVKSDADLVCESFNRGPIAWLTAYNFPNAVPPRVYRKLEPEEDLDALAKRDRDLKECGFRRTLESVAEVYGEGYEEAAEPPPALPGAPGGDPASGDDAASAEELEDGGEGFAAPDDVGAVLLAARSSVDLVRKLIAKARQAPAAPVE